MPSFMKTTRTIGVADNYVASIEKQVVKIYTKIKFTSAFFALPLLFPCLSPEPMQRIA